MARVLIAEDDPVSGHVLRYLVGRPGTTVTMVRSGEAALQELQLSAKAGTPYDVLITDAIMGGMDGLTLIERAAQESLAKLRVLVTAHDDMRKAGRGSPHADAVFSKPVDAGALRTLLEHHGDAAATRL